MPYTLIRDTVSRDTIEALETLLDGAKRGDVTGIAYAVTLRKRRYITNVAGFCFKNPTFARGMVWALSDELGALVHRLDPDETR